MGEAGSSSGVVHFVLKSERSCHSSRTVNTGWNTVLVNARPAFVWD